MCGNRELMEMDRRLFHVQSGSEICTFRVVEYPLSYVSREDCLAAYLQEIVQNV